MKICFFGNASDYRVQQLIGFFAQRGHETLLLTHASEFEEIDGTKVQRLTDTTSIPGIVQLFRLKQIREILKNFCPDYLFISTVWPRGIYGALLGFHPLVLSAWGSDIAYTPEQSWIRRLLVRYALRMADAVRVHDEAAKLRVVELGCREDKVIIHIRGTDTQIFSPESRSEQIRSILGIGDSTTIISLRKLTFYYDVRTLIMAVPKVIQKYKNVRFILCGDGNQKASLVKLIGDLEVSDYVHFVGTVPHDEIASYLASSDIFVDTYHTTKAGGGIGIGLIEAMSCGLAPVIAKRPGIDFGVKNGINGLHFEGGDAEDLAQKIIMLLDDQERIKLYAQRSREYMLRIADYNRNLVEFERELHLKLFGSRDVD